MEALREQGDPTDEHQADSHDRSYLWHRGKIRDDIRTFLLLYPFGPPFRPLRRHLDDTQGVVSKHFAWLGDVLVAVYEGLALFQF